MNDTIRPYGLVADIHFDGFHRVVAVGVLDENGLITNCYHREDETIKTLMQRHRDNPKEYPKETIIKSICIYVTRQRWALMFFDDFTYYNT